MGTPKTFKPLQVHWQRWVPLPHHCLKIVNPRSRRENVNRVWRNSSAVPHLGLAVTNVHAAMRSQCVLEDLVPSSRYAKILSFCCNRPCCCLQCSLLPQSKQHWHEGVALLPLSVCDVLGDSQFVFPEISGRGSRKTCARRGGSDLRLPSSTSPQASLPIFWSRQMGHRHPKNRSKSNRGGWQPMLEVQGLNPHQGFSTFDGDLGSSDDLAAPNPFQDRQQWFQELGPDP